MSYTIDREQEAEDTIVNKVADLGAVAMVQRLILNYVCCLEVHVCMCAVPRLQMCTYARAYERPCPMITA